MKEVSRPNLLPKERSEQIKEYYGGGQIAFSQGGEEGLAAFQREWVKDHNPDFLNGETPATPQELGIGFNSSELTIDEERNARAELGGKDAVAERQLAIFLRAADDKQFVDTRSSLQRRAESGDVSAIHRFTHGKEYKGLHMARAVGPQTEAEFKRRSAIRHVPESKNGEEPSTPEELGIGSYGNDLSGEQRAQLRNNITGYSLINENEMVKFLRDVNGLQQDDK